MTLSKQIDRVPELDGMRGLAILMVLFYHIVRLNPAEVTHPIFEKIMQFAEMGRSGCVFCSLRVSDNFNFAAHQEGRGLF
jgi:peptidoglycan/LPS O-acetylase OafA/YrhL